MVNKERIRDLLVEMVQIDSHSRKERQMAECVAAYCSELGADVVIDNAGEKVGGNTGNVIARFPGTVTGAEPILLSAHMDTVVPGEGVRPVVDGDIVRSDGNTILGGDDKSGIAVILESIRTIKEQQIPHTGIEAVFSICEEIGLLGAKHMDTSRLRSRLGLVFDSEEPDQLFTRGPSANHLEFRIHGLESHAGVAPELGISAIRIAAEGIASMKLGRIDDETTANIGVIEGGKATNIVTNYVLLKGEARSLKEEKLNSQTQHMVEALHNAARGYEVTVDGKLTRARVEEIVAREYPAMDVPNDSRLVEMVRKAAARTGRSIVTSASGGGCDANVFNGKGIQCANLGTGMRAIHTVLEWIDVKDMVASAEIALEFIKLHTEMSV